MEQKSIKTILILFCISGMLAVIIGAFGAHGLESKIPAKSLGSYKTGVNYQFIHTLAGLISIVLYKIFEIRYFKIACWLFLIGIICFSGSIYLLTTRELTGIGFTGILGPITPLGGLFFILGWMLCIFGASKLKPN